jgi:hypothetical protein
MGRSCDTSSGLCVNPGCEGKTCARGEACAEGACVDACKDARCPHGAECKAGACADARGMFPITSDAGSQAGSAALPAAGSPPTSAGTSLPIAENAAGAPSTRNSAAPGGSRSVGSQLRSTDGCGCRIFAAHGAKPATSAWLTGFGLSGFVLARRALRRSRRPRRAAPGCRA